MPMTSKELLPAIQRLHALSQTGLAYVLSEYDRERYQEIRDIILQLLANLSDVTIEQIIKLFPNETGYVTPKVDIRAIVFRGIDDILMVKEKMDNDRWTVPGGWADVGYSPFEVAQKEAWEETGLDVKAVRLLAVFDKSRHEHPYEPWYVYKFFILCEIIGGELSQETTETSGTSWINFESIPDLQLSEFRVTQEQLRIICKFAVDPSLAVICD